MSTKYLAMQGNTGLYQDLSAMEEDWILTWDDNEDDDDGWNEFSINT